MTILQAIILGILQGITEFLPISSSGHLVIAETFFRLDVAELKDFDVAVHVGTLLAILVYFRKDLIKVKYWPWLILGTIPAVIIGLAFENQIDSFFRSASTVGITMMIMGAIFLLPEKYGAKGKKLNWRNVILIGIAQAIALIPGVSRSGSTIFTGTLLGLKREEAARFSFMLGAIAIAGAGLLTAMNLGEITLGYDKIAFGFTAAFISGMLSVSWLMKYLKTHSLRNFGIYLLAIGFLTVTLLIL